MELKEKRKRDEIKKRVQLKKEVIQFIWTCLQVRQKENKIKREKKTITCNKEENESLKLKLTWKINKIRIY